MKKIRIGNGFDVHALQEGLPMWLGGIRIEHNKGFVAHSDGDILIHALCDALLGALALGDIGLHFPDNAQAFKGIDSKILLRKCVGLVHEKGFEIGNVDCTILAQAPKLRPYIDRMRETLAPILGIAIDEVSVKATTTERLGFTGREEGVAVYATALLYQK
ncbi:2-C-methyl-D-erythritol 2,4-cyclodiphosphate synthase [uncultured Rikenella sp.]|uniref:2-C-methyl-D-erythritol 2,4-cyclodiphosphate synthase n=1 Tax=uncultured Rikenella sp. TaxID=368003 RepID=UPI0025D1AD7A|nr:2-C-methyl-D-erythritol 2,4-cyclodiphosphate synthase [uncultured Rikenella sp.]